MIDKVIDGRRIRRSTRTRDFQKATGILEAETKLLDRRLFGEHWSAVVDEMARDQKSWLHRTAQSLAYRSTRRGWSECISASQLEQVLRRSGGQCELTGIAFDLNLRGRKAPPFHPSIDRMDSTKGYTCDNARVVCLAVNLCMREWGADVIEAIGRALVVRRLQEWESACRQTHLPQNYREKKNSLEGLSL